MSKDLSVALSPAAPGTAILRRLRAPGIVLAGSVLVAACAHLSVPLFFTPVPLTLQDFAVLVLGLLLPPGLAAATMGAYLAEGALGLPVFAPGPHLVPGPAHLFGPTGGYLLAYVVAAPLISILFRRGRRGFAWAFVGAAIGDLLILFCGAVWLAALTHASPRFTLAQAVLPFLPGSALKVAAAAGLAAGRLRLRRARDSRPN
ncbi:MAG TPA: biotin transporter BioY [Terracidiphilus sp.]|nr:biotin transporter BioY [Terracidiphilus sp.]